MTWAERVGDVATNVALVLINFARIFSLVLRIAAEKVDGFVTGLAERSEVGISPTSTVGRTWVRLPASVAWGIAAIVLRSLSIITVFVRQATSTLDEFLRALAEEADAGRAEPQPQTSPEPQTPPVYGTE